MEERSLKYSMDAEQQSNDSISTRTRAPICIPRLAESIPRNRFLSSVNVYKFGLRDVKS